MRVSITLTRVEITLGRVEIPFFVKKREETAFCVLTKHSCVSKKNIVCVEITFVRGVITLLLVEITLCVRKTHSARKNHTLRVIITIMGVKITLILIEIALLRVEISVSL
jgi:uncharacterized membrane protein YhaH (DUF805 family)